MTSTWLFLQSSSSPPTCFCGANLLRTPITSHCDTESTWSHCPPSLSVGTSEVLFSSSESDLIYSPSLHNQLSCYLGSYTFHLSIKAHEKVHRHFTCHFCTALLSRNVTTEVLMTKGMSLAKQSLLCATQPTHTQNLIRKPHHFLDPKIGKLLTTALKLWVKSKINRCPNTDYITVTDALISSGLGTGS